MKLVLIVQARMGSTRLPGKILLPVQGKPMLAHLVDRLRQVKHDHKLVIATTRSKRDDLIVDFCTGNRVDFFRGDEMDVLSRYAEAASQYQADVIVRLTSDCPLIDPGIVDRVISCYFNDNRNRVYASNRLNRTFPRGMDVEIFSRELLFEAYRNARSEYDREHVSPYLIRNDNNDINQRNVECHKNWSAYRFTLDYPKDYIQISGLLNSNLQDYSLDTLMHAAVQLGLNWHDNDEQVYREEREYGQGQLARFGIGTAQFGMYYGRFNREGVPSLDSARQILENATGLGLSCIDTAHDYGEAEVVLGSCHADLSAFSIITKTPRFSDEKITRMDALRLREAFEESLRLMRRKSINGLLIHHAPNLLTTGAEFLYQEMERIRDDGLVHRIGVSGYTGEIVETIHDRFRLDFVQLPINLLDRRLTKSGCLKRLFDKGIQIHARSAFLQGLLLADPDSLSAHFRNSKDVLKAFRTAAQLSGVKPAHAALHYLLRLPEVEKIIVGVESLSQFVDVFEDFPANVEMDFDPFFVDEVEVLNPVLWVN